VEDLDGEVLACLTQDRLFLLLDDLPGTVVRIDDMVADLVDQLLGLARYDDLDVVRELVFGLGVSRQGDSPYQGLGARPVSTSAGNGPRG
jgi:hypothetical protein